MGVCFWNFSDRTIGWGVIDPCTQGVACVHARKGLHSQGSMWLDQNGQKNASPFSSTFSFGHSKCFIFVKLVFTMCKVKISYDGLTAVLLKQHKMQLLACQSKKTLSRFWVSRFNSRPCRFAASCSRVFTKTYRQLHQGGLFPPIRDQSRAAGRADQWERSQRGFLLGKLHACPPPYHDFTESWLFV